MHIHTELSDRELYEKALERGIHLAFLSQYYFQEASQNIPQHILVLNYSALTLEQIPDAIRLLAELI